jgi:hypothetical protein
LQAANQVFLLSGPIEKSKMATSGGHKLTWQPYGKYVKQTSSQEPLDGLEPYLAEMFLARSLLSVVTFCSDRSSNMAARGHKSL